MFDPRIIKLAEGLVRFSCAVQPGENVLIESIGGTEDLTRALIKEVYKAGGNPFLWLSDKVFERELLKDGNPEQLKCRAKADAALMEQMQAFIGIRAGANASEMSDVPAEKMNDYMKYYWTPSMVRSACRKQNGSCCVILRPAWHSWRT
jgi:aminopeptidase